MLKRKRSRGLLGTILLTVLLAVAAYAFTAVNTVPASYAGDGQGVINPYTVTPASPLYTLDGADQTKIKSIAFTLNAAANQVLVSVTGAAPYQSCTIAGGVNVTCTFATEPTVASALNLRVIATD
ncbi:MAG: hypothetical protein ABSC51_09405 [Gaiellaceae bacterium]|jgi:hypothetical protein